MSHLHKYYNRFKNSVKIPKKFQMKLFHNNHKIFINNLNKYSKIFIQILQNNLNVTNIVKKFRKNCKKKFQMKLFHNNHKIFINNLHKYSKIFIQILQNNLNYLKIVKKFQKL